jgi:ribonucleoside-diphosphate reductase beta chain
MSYSVFDSQSSDPLIQPMFFGQSVSVSRYDQQKFAVFEGLINKQLSFFWRPEEVDISQDRADFKSLSDHEKHIFISNLQYQSLLDSVQGRAPNIAFLQIVSLPELETWIETWSFSETIHSRSYTHIIRNIFNQPEEVFNEINNNRHIIERAVNVTKYYDKLIELVNIYSIHGFGIHNIEEKTFDCRSKSIKKALYLTILSVNVLEAIRFYVSFACSFAFAENRKMEGNAKIIKLIARDEALHLMGTQQIINLIRTDKDDPELTEIAKECETDAYEIFVAAANQEKDWADYLFKDGSMIGLNAEILKDYVEYITNVRMKSIGLPAGFKSKSNPLPWMNQWLNSDEVQVAPQEAEISSYLTASIDSSVDSNEFASFKL